MVAKRDDGKRVVEFYLTLEPRFSSYANRSGERALNDVVATKLTQKRPERSQRSGSVVLKLAVRVPESIFQPLAPQVIIDIPESAAQVVPIEVVAEHPEIP